MRDAGRTDRTRRLATLAMLGCVLVAACAQGRKTPPEPEPAPPPLAAATFDAAWTIVYETHFDPEFNGVDWVAVGEEFRPRAVNAATLMELRVTISEMLQRLEQSHFALIPTEVVDKGIVTADGEGERGEGDVGLALRVIEDRLVVYTVEPDGPADRAGVRPGWVLQRVGDERTEDWVESLREIGDWRDDEFLLWAVGVSKLSGEPGSTVRVEFLDAVDDSLQLDLERMPIPGQPVKFGNLPPFLTRFDSRKIHSEELGVDVGVIHFNFWMVPVVPRIDAAVDEFRDKDGIVLDLRGNQGGVGAMVSGVSGHFLDDRVDLGVMKMRTQELRIVANPRRVDTSGKRVRPYDGPVAVLVDRASGSASEMFAGGMQDVGRVRVFGRTTVGGVLPASMDRLPNGDVLYHAFAEYLTPSGIALEGRGVIPDEIVPLTREDLLSGRDATMVAALRWIAEQKVGDARTAN